MITNLTKKEIIENNYLDKSQFDLLIMYCKEYIHNYYEVIGSVGDPQEKIKLLNESKLKIYEFLPWNIKVSFNSNYPDKIGFAVFDLLDKGDELKMFRLDAMSGEIID